MTLTKEHLRAVIMTGTLENRVEELRKILGYPVKELDRTSSLFWYLRPGESAESAAETCPVAVGFYSELNDELRSQIYGHYSNRQAEQQPVMYLLLPSKEGTSRVPLVLPREGGLRQKDIKTFEWNEPELQRRISLLQKDNLPIAHKAICSVPSVKWVFYEPVKTASELAKSLAEAAHKIEQAIHTVYKYEERIHPNKGENGYLHKLLKSFQLQLLRSLELNPIDENDYSFPDMYAQTITYGLFTARVFSYVRDKKAPFNQESAWQQIPKTNPFLRHLFQDLLARSREEFKELGDELIEAITEVRSILCTAEMDAILWDFQQKMYQEDIVIRFYEDFLAAYKSTMRECRGVYYTPEPIVSYIVRSVDRILQTDFELPDGLADATKVEVKKQDGISETHKVLITDIATGTGGFLYSVIDHIHRSLKPSQEVWSRYVSQNLLPRLLGFELLMAPYAIAHMKLGLQLAALGYKFDTEERLRVYLTNTLQEAFQIPPADGYDNWIRDEADAANKIKQEAPVMVVLGNPPYSGHSANNGAWISNLLKGKDIISQQATQSYFEVDGKPLGERNPKWLNDDYVKFIRFAQWRIEKTGYGILAFVTNHGYLDNPTFRGMRQSLMETFDEIYVLDLHGNAKKKERCPDDSKDENVFDIQQGVAISIFVKRLNGKKEVAKVYHAHLWGIREIYKETPDGRCLVGGKYHWLRENDVTTTGWNKLKPQSPFYLFVPQDNDLLAEYEQGWKVTEAMPVNVLGFQTHRDHFAIDFSKSELYKRIEEMCDESISNQEYAEKYDLKDNRDWKLNEARRAIRREAEWQNKLTSCLYRPFDRRSCYFSTVAMDYPRRELINHVAGKNNLVLNLPRIVKLEEWQHALIADVPCTAISMDINGSYVFPLYLYEEQLQANFSQDFLNDITKKLDHTPSPEAIFYYIYAILYSPTYRTRYAEFLKIDFPRVPLTSSDELFRQLAAYGEELVALHLMKSPKLDSTITQYEDRGGDRVVDAGLKYQQGDVIINKKGDRFSGVPENVWNFYVGGYQVCQKWLKDRKGRTLSDEDILHYRRIVVALQETIELMAKIDAAIPGFPIQ